MNISVEQRATESLDVITLTVDSLQQPVHKDFSTLVTKLSNIVKIDILGQTRATIAPVKAVHNAAITEEQKAAIVKTEGRKLVAVYPDIREPLTMLEATLPPAARSELMMRLGTALGQWQYKKVYVDSSRLNKTVQSSLKMQRSQFQGLPVISDLLATGKKKQQSVDVAAPIKQLELLLSDYLDIDMDSGRIVVKNCPHCAAERTPWEPDCHFIKRFMQGFVLDIADLKGATVSQISSKALSGNACVFEIIQS